MPYVLLDGASTTLLPHWIKFLIENYGANPYLGMLTSVLHVVFVFAGLIDTIGGDGRVSHLHPFYACHQLARFISCDGQEVICISIKTKVSVLQIRTKKAQSYNLEQKESTK